MKTVTIGVETTTGTITVVPHRAQVHRGEELRWSIKEADAATISFSNASPFDRKILRSEHDPTVIQSPPVTGLPGDYKYGVAVSVRSILYVEDPIISVL